MNIAAAFFKAAHEESSPLTCLGIPLRHYSLWHQIALKAVDSPFVLDGKPDWDHLIFGVFLCSQTKEDFEKSSKSFAGRLAVKIWGWWIARQVRRRRINLAEEMVNFRDYVRDGLEEPDINNDTRKQGRTFGSPWEARLKVLLMREFPQLSESTILNRPLRLSNIEFAVMGELEGTIEPFNSQDEELFRIAKGMPREEAKA